MKLASLTLLIVTTIVSVGHEPFAAQAQDFELHIGEGRNRDYRPDRDYREGRNRDYRPDRDYGEERYDRGCSPREAIRNALRRGMIDPQIIEADSRRIVIEGYGRRNEYTRLRLANRQGCPRIG
ncbi:hypothetical protein RMR21_001300 [Agrobacterium sp. rho-8.1]|nr:hypothetical protein [Agrobacterium sp. rho-8.1]